jgi:peptidoglycan/xylan/chitin deacetylase (PgdA/CDA1 family)
LLLIIGGILLVLYFSIWSRPNGSSTKVGTWVNGRPLHSFNSCGQNKMIAMTFDDGPDPTTTPTLLADLKSAGIKGTFFISPAIGSDPSQAQCSLIEQMISEGHSVQSHSWDHTDFSLKGAEDMYLNLQKNFNWIKSCANSRSLDVTMFRPPYGNMDPAHAAFVSQLGYTLASWTIDSQDVAIGNNSPQQLFDGIKLNFNNVPAGYGAVIIMHDKQYGSTRGVFDLIVPYFKQLGYSFVTAPQCYAACKHDVCESPNKVWPGTWATIY